MIMQLSLWIKILQSDTEDFEKDLRLFRKTRELSELISLSLTKCSKFYKKTVWLKWSLASA